jgi:hypothetical protein
MTIEPIEVRIKKLPAHLRNEVIDFIDFLTEKHRVRKGSGNFTFSWEGGLSVLKDKYEAVELQHKAAGWR